ncbi:MAG: NAD-dependent epimerase/dehydratase family protein [Chlamydiota bacterium]
MTKRVFITGAAGFIGFHLARFLRDRGDEVLGYDNFNDYYDPTLKEERVRRLEGVSVLRGDLCDEVKLSEIVDQFEPTHIVNLAAQAGVRYSLENPQAYIKSNIDGFLNVLEICRNAPEIKLIYASSSSVYGTNRKIPFSIDDPCDHQASLYGVTKKSNELMATTYHHLYGIRVTGLRFFTVYGEWGRPDMAYFSFTKKILNQEPIKVFNHGKMMRDFTYISDIVKGTAAAIDLGAPCELFNLGNHQPVSIERFIEIIEEELGVSAVKDYLPMQLGDVEKTYADIDHSRKLLSFSPEVSLEEGLSNFICW